MPPKKGGKGKKDDVPARKTRCPIEKGKDGITYITYEWAEAPKLYALASMKPTSKAIRKCKEYLATAKDEESFDPNLAIQYAISRGNTIAVEVLIQAGIDTQNFVYSPPLTEEELAYLWKQREAKRMEAQAQEEAAAKNKKK